jgi:hydrogenase expression/formation protein HypC
MCLAIPGRVLETTDVAGMLTGKVDFAGVTRRVCLAYVPQARAGDYVLVHVGFALSLLDEAEAEQTLELLASLGVLEQELSSDDVTAGSGP